MAIIFTLNDAAYLENVKVALDENDPCYLATKKLFLQADKAFPKDLDDDDAIDRLAKKGWWEKWEKAYDKFRHYLNKLVCKAVVSNNPAISFTANVELLENDYSDYPSFWEGQDGDVSDSWGCDIYESITHYRTGRW